MGANNIEIDPVKERVKKTTGVVAANIMTRVLVLTAKKKRHAGKKRAW
ncbi:hypothetical protein [Methanosarcina horonobensis]|nr:hypothetical protein [Methanosarcina horonobensis]